MNVELSVSASVIITTRNRSHLVGRAIQSALGCSNRLIEVVVVDDASEDGTPQVLAAFEDQRVHSHRLDLRQGRVKARNYAVSVSTGDILVFLDDDDEFLDGGLGSLIDSLVREDSGTVGSYGIPRYVSGSPELGYTLVERALPGLGSSGAIFMPLLSRNFIQPGAVAVRKAPFLSVGGFTGDVEPIALEDWRLWLQMSVRGRFAYLPQEVVQILRHDGNTPENLFTPSKCEYFGSQEFEQLLKFAWKSLSDDERAKIGDLLLSFASSCQGREEFALARLLVGRARSCGVKFGIFDSRQLWRSWIPRFWRRQR